METFWRLIAALRWLWTVLTWLAEAISGVDRAITAVREIIDSFSNDDKDKGSPSV